MKHNGIIFSYVNISIVQVNSFSVYIESDAKSKCINYGSICNKLEDDKEKTYEKNSYHQPNKVFQFSYNNGTIIIIVILIITIYVMNTILQLYVLSN